MNLKYSEFRGSKMKLDATYELMYPPENAGGILNIDIKNSRLDRWLPISKDDKINLQDIPERWLEWSSVGDGIFYGVERWGDIIPKNYLEYYAIIVIRPTLTLPAAALGKIDILPPNKWIFA